MFSFFNKIKEINPYLATYTAMSKSILFLNLTRVVAGEMTQWVRENTVLAEDQSSVLCTHVE